MTTVSLPMLSRVRVASPCPVKWDDMHAVGDGERVRHCDECSLNVYNISAMTSEEAEALLVAHEGRRLCGRIYRREDGTVLTRDCPVGLVFVRAKMARTVARMSAVVGLLLAWTVTLGARARGEPVRLRSMDPFAKIVAWLNPVAPPPPPISGKFMITSGVIACPPPPRSAPGQAVGPTPRPGARK